VAACRKWLGFAASFRKRVEGHADPIFDEPLSKSRSLSHVAQIDLLRASLNEAWMGHLPIEPPMAVGADPADEFTSTPHGTFNKTRAQRAEKGFRDALTADPTMTESALRLGRLTYLVGSPQESRALLERLSKGPSQTRWVTALADLFLADLHAFEGRPGDAATAYRRALARDPALGPAYVGLSQLQREQGEDGDAVATVNAGIRAQQAIGELWNPLATYESAQFHSANEQLAELREIVASHFAKAVSTPMPRFAYLSPPPAIPAALTQNTIDNTTLGSTRKPGAVFSETEGVRLVVRVMKDGHPVRGLRANDFVVTDSGVRQDVTAVSESAGVMIAVAVDVSQFSVAQMARVSRGPQVLASAMRDDDRMTVVTISDAVMTTANNVPRSARLTDLLAALAPDRFGMTALWDGMYTAMTLAESRERIPYVLVSGTQVAIGGGDNASWLTLDQVKALAKRSDVVVDAVWNSITREKARPDRGYYREMDFVFGGGHANEVISSAAGRTFSADDPELAAKLRSRLDEVRDGYILTYTPKDVRRGGWHPIKVTTVAGRATTRPGYGKEK